MAEFSKTSSYDALLVGLGSVGKKHLRTMRGMYRSILVVDPDPSVKNLIENDNNEVLVNNFNYLKNLKFESIPRLAVIANWGPDHFLVFAELVKIGVKQFIIEKPLVDSFSELNKMKKLIESEKLVVKTNLPLIYSDLVREITSVANLHSLGEPLSIYVHGGAKCVATIGIHYIALANKIFQSRPIFVNSYLKSDDINPRSHELSYLEGNSNWVYPKSKYLSVSFSNSSQIEFSCSILYKRAEIILGGGNITIKTIPRQLFINLDKPTKTLPATEVVLQKSITSKDSENKPFDILYREFNIENLGPLFDEGFGATEDLLFALLASELNTTLSLPFDYSAMGRLVEKKWNIS